MPTITIAIDAFGQPAIDAKGFTGTACQKATAPFEAAFRDGAERVQTTRKPELYATAGPARATQTIGGK